MSAANEPKQASLEPPAEVEVAEEKPTKSGAESNSSDEPSKTEQTEGKEDDSSARARSRRERFKALQARAVSNFQIGSPPRRRI